MPHRLCGELLASRPPCSLKPVSEFIQKRGEAGAERQPGELDAPSFGDDALLP
jgi:hypothetical protein